jgi:hypothetical protein
MVKITSRIMFLLSLHGEIEREAEKG